MCFTPQAKEETGVMFWNVLSAELHLLSWIWAESSEHGEWCLTDCVKELLSLFVLRKDRWLFPVEAEWKSIFCFNLLLPIWYKKVLKVGIADASISAVVLFLPFQNKIFSQLLYIPWVIINPLLSAREEGAECFLWSWIWETLWAIRAAGLEFSVFLVSDPVALTWASCSILVFQQSTEQVKAKRLLQWGLKQNTEKGQNGE